MTTPLYSVVGLFIQGGQDGTSVYLYDKILAVSRKDNHADLGLPGGKIEPGDATPEDAIRREILEEVGVTADILEPVFDHLDRVEGSVPKPCRCFRVHTWKGEPRPLEGSWVGWVPLGRLLEPTCMFKDYNRKLFEALGFIVPFP